jgi:hypothetical protein
MKGPQTMVQRENPHRMLKALYGATIVLMALAALAACRILAVKPADRQGFSSPREAVDALIAAVRNDNDSELLGILGPDAEDLIASGDQVADRNSRKRFLAAFEEKNSLEQQEADRMVLIVGIRDYPFPIPLLKQGGAWYFDTAAGREEILNRRIGRNELHTIEVMQAYTDAQREYACLEPNGDGPVFAQRFASSEGRKDGLYWPATAEGPESPFGPLIARAVEEGYSGGLDEEPPEAFHGYYFKILKGQGPHACGGAFDYVVNGKMVLGFALAAYPARYGASGIMTFIVNQAGVIYEKDLGENTGDEAVAMTSFDPDETWHRHE